MVALLAMALVPSPAGAQQPPFESIGSRALGMGGAFVAVADDPSAIHWNPAGLATAGPVAATIEWSQFRIGNQKGTPTAGPSFRKSSFTSLGTWPIGLSYGTQESTMLVQSDAGPVAQTLKTRQFAATLLQSIVEGLVVGVTFRYVRGGLASELAQSDTAGKALDHGASLDSEKTNGAFDYDVGVMADMKRLRVGVTSRNLRSPTFVGAAGTSITMHRQSRLGLAVLPTDGLTLATDVDLDTVDLRDGLRRMIAFGGEERLGKRLVVRGGVRWSLRGPRRRVYTAGGSFSLRPRFWLDAHFTQGHVDGDRGFGLALRAGF
jgi:hypothetical protein